MITYPHCEHCATSHPEHADPHETPCGSWNGRCSGNVPAGLYAAEAALFAGFEIPVILRKPTAVPEAQLVVLAEIAIKEAAYPEGVPAVGMAKDYRLEKMAEAGLVVRITLPDPDGHLEEGPRRLRLTDAGRTALDAYDAWAETGGFTTMRGFVLRHLVGGAA